MQNEGKKRRYDGKGGGDTTGNVMLEQFIKEFDR